MHFLKKNNSFVVLHALSSNELWNTTVVMFLQGVPSKKVVHFVLRGIESPNGSYMLAFIYICSFAGKQVCI